MEQGYCSKDDYISFTEKLKYKFVPKGHYAVRQGNQDSDVYFIIQGSANVLETGPIAEQNYLDKKAMYNEITVQRAKTKNAVRLMLEAKELLTTTMIDVLSYVQIQTTDAAVVN